MLFVRFPSIWSIVKIGFPILGFGVFHPHSEHLFPACSTKKFLKQYLRTPYLLLPDSSPFIHFSTKPILLNNPEHSFEQNLAWDFIKGLRQLRQFLIFVSIKSLRIELVIYFSRARPRTKLSGSISFWNKLFITLLAYIHKVKGNRS